MIWIAVFLLLFIISTLLEGIITPIPLIWVLLLILAITPQRGLVFFLAFFLGIILDVLSTQPIGKSSALFTGFLFLVFLYERKYETNSLQFVAVASFIGGLLYMTSVGADNGIVGALLATIYASVIFLFTNVRKKSEEMSSYPTRGITQKTQ